MRAVVYQCAAHLDELAGADQRSTANDDHEVPVTACLCHCIEPGSQPGIEIVEIAEAAGEEEVLARSSRIAGPLSGPG